MILSNNSGFFAAGWDSMEFNALAFVEILCDSS